MVDAQTEMRLPLWPMGVTALAQLLWQSIMEDLEGAECRIGEGTKEVFLEKVIPEALRIGVVFVTSRDWR